MKKLTAIVLIFAMLLSICATSSFAFSNGDKVTFTMLDSTESERYCVGEAFLGENHFEYNGGETSVFYKFNAEKSGYYSANVYYACFAQKTSDSAAAQIESEAFYYNEGCCYIYLEKGTYFIADSFSTSSPEPADINVKIEYLGEFKEVSYDESAFDNAVEDVDVDMYNQTLFNAEPKIVFENGSLDDLGGHIALYCDEELKVGKNNVKFEIADVEFEEVLTIVSIVSTIESIEIEDLDDFAVVYEYYCTHERVNPSDYGTTVTVNYKDGTTASVEYYYDPETDEYHTNIPLPNENERHLAIYQTSDPESGKIYLIAKCEDRILLKEECSVKKVSMSENIDYLSKEINTYINFLSETISWCFQYMFDPEAFGFEYYFTHLIDGISLYTGMIFDEISEFVGYYMGT